MLNAFDIDNEKSYNRGKSNTKVDFAFKLRNHEDKEA